MKKKNEKMSDFSFKVMTVLYKIVDFIIPYINRRIKKFGIKQGMTIVDYGCGPGRYSTIFSKLVGNEGLVYAIDIHEIAIAAVENKIKKKNITNIKTFQITGYDDGKYDTKLSDNTADIVCAIDMFFMIKKPNEFLSEIKRILRKSGTLIIDYGPQSRKKIKRKIQESDLFNIIEETRDHLKCSIK